MSEGNQILSLLEQHQVPIAVSYAKCMESLTDFGPNAEAIRAINRALFSDDEVLAFRLKRHATHEMLGAKFIEAVAREFASGELLKEMDRHSQDEYRHGGIFMGLYKAVRGSSSEADDPSASVDAELAAFDGNLKSFFYATHVAEVRNYFLLAQYLDILQSSEKAYKRKLVTALESVKRDEVNHVVYTARYINQWMDNSTSEQQYFSACLADYTRMSWQEVALIANCFAQREVPVDEGVSV